MTRIGVTKKIMNIPVVKNDYGIVSKDLVKGISKKGRFEIESYKNELGSLVARNYAFWTNGKKTEKRRFYGYGVEGSRNRSYTNLTLRGNEWLNESENVFLFDSSNINSDVWMLERKIDPIVESHKISYLSPGKKKKSLSYKTSYNGENPTIIETEGLGNKKFPEGKSKYLPLITTANSNNVEQKIKHISAMQEKKYQLEGIVPPIERVPEEVLQPSEGCICGGDCAIETGQIRVNDTLYQSIDLLDVLAHEYKHAYDASNICRLDVNAEMFSFLPKGIVEKMREANFKKISFAEKSIKKGIIKYNSKFGREVRKTELEFKIDDFIPYSERIYEQNARKASLQEVKQYNSCWNAIGNFFRAKFIIGEKRFCSK